MSSSGTSFSQSKMSLGFLRVDLCSIVMFCLSPRKFFTRSYNFCWFKISTFFFRLWQNFILTSWVVNFYEIFSDSLYHVFGPNWTCPYLWDLAAWIADKLERAEILFFNFLNKASLLTNYFLLTESLDLSALLWFSSSLSSCWGLQVSTPPFLTRVRKRFDQPPYTGDGTENSKPTGARSCCFSSDSCLTLAILLNTNRENVFLSRRLRLFPLFTFCSTFRCLGQAWDKCGAFAFIDCVFPIVYTSHRSVGLSLQGLVL